MKNLFDIWKAPIVRGLFLCKLEAYNMLYHELRCAKLAAAKKLTAKEIGLNRKVLADLAMNHPDAFKAVIDAVK